MGWFGSDKKQTEAYWKTEIVSKHPYEDVKIEIQSEPVKISRDVIRNHIIISGNEVSSEFRNDSEELLGTVDYRQVSWDPTHDYHCTECTWRFEAACEHCPNCGNKKMIKLKRTSPGTSYIFFFRDGEYCRIKEDSISNLEGPQDLIPISLGSTINVIQIEDSVTNRSKLNFEGDNGSNLDFKDKDTLVSKDKESVFSEIIGSTDITMDDEFLYFMYADGYLARVPKPKNTDELYPILLELSQRERLSMMLTHYGSKYSNFIKNDFNDYLKKIQDEKERKEQERMKRIEQEKIERERKEQERMKRIEQEKKKRLITRAEDYVEHLDYDRAITIYEEMGDKKAAKRVRKLKANLAAPKTEIHGDYIDDRDTIVKDSVINRSNVGAGGKTKAEEIKEIKELLDSGAIDDDEFKQMKKEILGK